LANNDSHTQEAVNIKEHLMLKHTVKPLFNELLGD
jgi:hypothetical protein